MAVIYDFTREDLLRVRFALHPLGELLWSVVALDDPASHGIHLPWIERARTRLDGLDIELLTELSRTSPAGYGVDFLAPPPTTPLPDVGSEIARVGATPARQVRIELRRRYADEDVPAVVRPLLERPERGLGRLTRLMHAYWDRAVEPDWTAIRGLAEADIARRSRHLAERGAGSAFVALHHDVTFAGSQLTVARDYEETVELAGRGLLLVPTAFAWPQVFCLFDAPWQPALVYPPLAAGELWEPRADGAEPALDALLGARRHRVLAATDAPASTSELATRLALPASSVSEHLTVLRDAGLVLRVRDGRHVRYVTTELGARLLSRRWAAARTSGRSATPSG